jgi:phage protein D
MNMATIDFDVLVDATAIAADAVVGFVVDLDLDQPSMCLVTLRNSRHRYNDKFRLGMSVEAKVADIPRGPAAGSAKTTVFKGELVGLEPSYTSAGESVFTLRAHDRLHRLTRGRKSKTYQSQSDQDIVKSVAQEHGLSVVAGSTPAIRHAHVYQHNQTDLEFLRARGKTIGYQIWCEDTKLIFDTPRLDVDSGLEFVLGEPSASGALTLTAFAARMSNAEVVKRLSVRGWNVERTQEFVGEARAGTSSPLGPSPGAATLGDFGQIDTFLVDHPIFSVEEARALATARLAELAMSFLTAEAEALGNTRIQAGLVVKIVVDVKNVNDPFNGKYLVRGCTHRIDAGSVAPAAYTMSMRLARDAASS